MYLLPIFFSFMGLYRRRTLVPYLPIRPSTRRFIEPGLPVLGEEKKQDSMSRGLRSVSPLQGRMGGGMHELLRTG